MALDAAQIVLVDSLIPEYGGNLFNIKGIEKEVTVNVADVLDEYSMRQLVRDKDVLFNLAGQTSHVDSIADPYTDLEINCRAQLSILESCRRNNPGIRIVYASTRQIYGRPESLPVDERHLLRPTDVNGINKMAGEWYHILYSNVHGIRASALRLTNTYGPRMRIKDARQTFLGVWIRSLLRGEEILIYGDGSQLRDFNYVDDAVEALLTAALSDKAVGEVFNLGAEPPLSLKELADLLIKLNGSGRSRIVPSPRSAAPSTSATTTPTSARWSGLLGWKPRIAPAEGLKRTHLYVVRSPERERVRETLRRRGIETMIHYPVPVHWQEGYAGLVRIGPGGLALTERLASEIFSLPLYPELTDREVDRVIEVVTAASASPG